MGTLKQILPALFLLAATPLPAGEEKTKGVDIELVSSETAIEPGKPFTVALHLSHHEGFHTYWKEPGIVGLPTSIEWTLPPGFSAGPIQWPAPKVVDMAGHPAHGFYRDVLLLVDITPPAKLKMKDATLTAKLAWMACSSNCYPGFGTRSLTLPIGASARDKTWSARIEAERAKLPGKCSSWIAMVESAHGAKRIALRLEPAKGTIADPGEIYFFSEDAQVSSEPPQKVKRKKDGSYLITSPRSEWGPDDYSTLPGTIVCTGTFRAGQKLTAIRIAPRYKSK